MGGRFFLGISSLRLRFLTALMVTMLLGLSAVSNAEEVTYIGDGGKLQEGPSWLYNESIAALFPGTEDAPLSSGNKVTVNYNPEVMEVINPDAIFGGISKTENAMDNRLILLNGKSNSDIYGGCSIDGTSTGNIVNVSGGTVRRFVFGGVSGNSDATSNIVIISGGSIEKHVYGGRGRTAASSNDVTVKKGVIGGVVCGGESSQDNAAGNSVTISGGFAKSNVYGGISTMGFAAGNVVTISGGSVDKDVCGGESFQGYAAGNTVTISGGSAESNIYGGISVIGAATGNVVAISGGLIDGNVFGGWSEENNATSNIITISGRPNLAKAQIYGGYTDNSQGDVFTGNTFNLKNSGTLAEGVGNFEYYNFYMPKDLAAGDVMLSVETVVSLTGTTVAIFLQGSTKLSEGDKITLIHSVAGVENAPKNKSCKVKHDSLLYEFSIYTDKNNLWAEVTKISAGTK